MNSFPLITKVFAALLTLLFLSCRDKGYSAEREIESGGMKIKVRASSRKEWDAGITGAGHTPLIIPYAGYEKSWGVNVQPANYDALLFEEYGNVSSDVSKEQMNQYIQQVNVTLSPNKKHLLYSRNDENYLLAHYFDDGKGFTAALPAGFNPADPDWSKIPPAEKIALNEINNKSNDFSLWYAIERLPPESEFDYAALRLFDSVSHARYHIEKRCRDWGERSGKWKNAVRTKLFGTLNGYENRYRRNEIVFYSVLSIVRYARDEQMDKAMIDFLMKDLNSDVPDKELSELFKDSLRPNLQQLRRQIEDHCKKLLESNSAQDKKTLLTIGTACGSSVLKDKAGAWFVKNWKDDKDIQYYVYFNFSSLTEAGKKSFVDMAESHLASSDSLNAIGLIEEHASCNKLLELNKKYPEKIHLRKECK